MNAARLNVSITRRVGARYGVNSQGPVLWSGKLIIMLENLSQKNMQKVGMSTSHLAIYVVFYYGFYIV